METKCNCKETMRLLRAFDFAILETALFLNAHPDHEEALAYYCELREKYDKLYAEYTENCGPLTIHTNDNKSSWDWVKTPWPWELDAD